MRIPFLISGILASATVVVASASSVSAFTISGNSVSNINSGDLNEMFTVTFDDNMAGASSELSADAQFTVTDWDEENIQGVDYTVATFSVRVRNTSSSNSRIYNMGFDTNSNVNADESTATNNSQGQTFNLSSNGSGAEVCLYSNGNCSGGSNGVNQGETGNYTVRLALENSSGGFDLDLNNFYVGYESPNRTSGGTGTNYETVMASSVDAPEPLTILGTGVAAGFGAIFRKEQQKKRKQKEKIEV
ncbi:MAG: cistern family PEP-CTERM protein [Cyanobacteria bacterium J06592_8]